MLKSGNIQNFLHLCQFNNQKQFERNIRLFIAENVDKLTKSEMVGFKAMVNYCIKYNGIGNFKIATVLKSINDQTNGNGISRSTFKRLLVKLQEMNVLQIHHTYKENNHKQGHSVYVFLEYQSTKQPNELPKPENIEPPKKTTQVLKTNNNKRRKEVDNGQMDHTFTPSNVPSEVVAAIKPYFNDAQKIFKLYGKALLAHKISKLERPVDNMTNVIIKAFKESVFAYKQNRIRKDFMGFYFGTLRGLFSVEKRKEVNHSTFGLFKEFMEA